LKRVQVWMFGLVDRLTKKCHIEIVKDRTGHSLLAPIFDHVIEGSIIFSDSWSAYSRITQVGEFQHRQVNHKYNFVEPTSDGEDELHTNRNALSR
jgi:IS1 family transposase